MAHAAVEPQPYVHVPGAPQYVMVPVRQSNGLGVFGFFVAVIGLFIPTGIIALLGLLICLVALGRSPRGFAMMGLIIGLFGTILWLLIDLAVLVVGLLAVVGMGLAASAAFMLTQPEVMEITSDMINSAIAIEHHYETRDELPTTLDELGLASAAIVDPWGTRYRYELNDPNDHDNDDAFRYELTSAGPDTIFGSDDDIMLSKLDRMWENAFDTFEEKMEDFNEKMQVLQHNGRSRYGCGSDGHARITVGDAGVEVIVMPATPDSPEPPRATSESYADVYERRAAEELDTGETEGPSADSEPQATPEPNYSGPA